MKQGAALVIGGGISGLAAALELAQNKISTTVSGVKNRFGGRIHTIRPNGIPVELGAEFVHGRSEPLLQAIKDAGSPRKPFPIRIALLKTENFKRVIFGVLSPTLLIRWTSVNPIVQLRTFSLSNRWMNELGILFDIL